MKNINTKEYWNNFFKEERFQKRHCWRINPYKGIQAVFDFSKINNKSIVDIGCAFGDGLGYLHSISPNNDYMGIDFSEECINQAKKKYPILNFYSGDINKFSKSVDLIMIVETLEHLDNDEELIKKLRKKCTILIISVPYNELGTRGKLIDEHVHSYTEKDFKGAKTYIKNNYLIAIYE